MSRQPRSRARPPCRTRVRARMEPTGCSRIDGKGGAASHSASGRVRGLDGAMSVRFTGRRNLAASDVVRLVTLPLTRYDFPGRRRNTVPADACSAMNRVPRHKQTALARTRCEAADEAVHRVQRASLEWALTAFRRSMIHGNGSSQREIGFTASGGLLRAGGRRFVRRTSADIGSRRRGEPGDLQHVAAAAFGSRRTVGAGVPAWPGYSDGPVRWSLPARDSAGGLRAAYVPAPAASSITQPVKSRPAWRRPSHVARAPTPTTGTEIPA